MTQLAEHWVERYGIKEVSQWPIEVWNEPNLSMFWKGDQAAYLALYEATWQALKAVSPRFHVGGPATAQNAWLPEFDAFCRAHHCAPDFLSTHYYPTDAFGEIGADTATQLQHAPPGVMRKRAAEARKIAGDRPLYYPGLVVFDEAYAPFASRDARHRLLRQPHVALMRTLSKFGLAGVRIGYLMAPAAFAAQIEKLRPPFNVSVLNTEAALFALEHEAVYEIQAISIRSQRERLSAALRALPGVTPFPSEANMVLARFGDAAQVFEALKARRILVKNVSAAHPLLANCLRLTVGTPEETELLIEALQQILTP